MTRSLRQIFTGEIPWPTLRDPEILRLICIERKQPPRPSELATQRGLDDAVWDLMQACWKGEPEERPTMSQVITHLTPDPTWRKAMTNRLDFLDPLSGRRITSNDNDETSSSLEDHANTLADGIGISKSPSPMVSLEDQMQILSQICDNGQRNASILSEMLNSASPEDLHEKDAFKVLASALLRFVNHILISVLLSRHY